MPPSRRVSEAGDGRRARLPGRRWRSRRVVQGCPHAAPRTLPLGPRSALLPYEERSDDDVSEGGLDGDRRFGDRRRHSFRDQALDPAVTGSAVVQPALNRYTSRYNGFVAIYGKLRPR